MINLIKQTVHACYTGWHNIMYRYVETKTNIQRSIKTKSRQQLLKVNPFH